MTALSRWLFLVIMRVSSSRLNQDCSIAARHLPQCLETRCEEKLVAKVLHTADTKTRLNRAFNPSRRHVFFNGVIKIAPGFMIVVVVMENGLLHAWPGFIAVKYQVIEKVEHRE